MALFAVAVPGTALAAPSARPFGPPPPSGCGTSLTTTTGLVSAGPFHDSTYNLDVVARLDGEFDSTTGQLCDLRAWGSVKNDNSGNYNNGFGVWVCLQTTFSNCVSTDIAASFASTGTVIASGHTLTLAGPWFSALTSECTGGKNFYAVNGYGMAPPMANYLVTNSWC